MLEAAIQAADKGVQVIIGVAESHGREDTMRLIGRLPRLPMKRWFTGEWKWRNLIWRRHCA